ncbi:hypothetical protein GOODEAATRI_000535 [Goodea atripinnis]|uniref:[2Fe-2S]-binding domain-containing protein n=1 Tax=Goodea atripinnis TaxID=208336 RepID=A0ABV0PU87_9TELE
MAETQNRTGSDELIFFVNGRKSSRCQRLPRPPVLPTPGCRDNSGGNRERGEKATSCTGKVTHLLQERIARSHGSQCGFCTPGIVMSMYALLRNNPTPKMADVEDAFQGSPPY